MLVSYDVYQLAQELMHNSVLFSRVMDEYGNLEKEKAEKEQKKEQEKAIDGPKKEGKKAGLIQEEERVTGSVAGKIYAKYFRFAGGLAQIPIMLLLLTGYQGSSGASVQLRYRQCLLEVLIIMPAQLPITSSWAFGQRKVYTVSRAATTWGRMQHSV